MMESDKENVSKVHKARLLKELQYYDKKIEESRTTPNSVSLQDENSSDSEDDFPVLQNNRQSISQLRTKQNMLKTCLQATQELTGVEVLQAEVNVMVDAPTFEGEPPVKEQGTWRDVTAECRIDLVPFSLVFYAHKADRNFAPVVYRGLKVSPVKNAHEIELSHTVLPNVKRPSDAVEMLRNYAAAYRSRRATLARLVDKFGEQLHMEPLPSGGYVLKCADLIEIQWILRNKWSPLARFHHSMKFDVEYMAENYVKAITQLHRQLSDPELETDDRTMLLAKIFNTCLEAQGPTRELHDSMSSDPESAKKLKSRRITLDKEPEIPITQPKKDKMAPPRTAPKRKKDRTTFKRSADGNLTNKVSLGHASVNSNVVEKRDDNDYGNKRGSGSKDVVSVQTDDKNLDNRVGNINNDKDMNDRGKKINSGGKDVDSRGKNDDKDLDNRGKGTDNNKDLDDHGKKTNGDKEENHAKKTDKNKDIDGKKNNNVKNVEGKKSDINAKITKTVNENDKQSREVGIMNGKPSKDKEIDTNIKDKKTVNNGKTVNSGKKPNVNTKTDNIIGNDKNDGKGNINGVKNTKDDNKTATDGKKALKRPITTENVSASKKAKLDQRNDKNIQKSDTQINANKQPGTTNVANVKNKVTSAKKPGNTENLVKTATNIPQSITKTKNNVNNQIVKKTIANTETKSKNSVATLKNPGSTVKKVIATKSVAAMNKSQTTDSAVKKLIPKPQSLVKKSNNVAPITKPKSITNSVNKANIFKTKNPEQVSNKIKNVTNTIDKENLQNKGSKIPQKNPMNVLKENPIRTSPRRMATSKMSNLVVGASMPKQKTVFKTTNIPRLTTQTT